MLLHGYSGRVAYGGGSGPPWECRRRVPAQGRRIASGSVCAVAVGDGVEGLLGLPVHVRVGRSFAVPIGLDEGEGVYVEVVAGFLAER